MGFKRRKGQWKRLKCVRDVAKAGVGVEMVVGWGGEVCESLATLTRQMQGKCYKCHEDCVNVYLGLREKNDLVKRSIFGIAGKVYSYMKLA